MLLCNQPELIRDIRTLDHCDFPSDHFPVEFSITQTFSRARRIRLNVYDFNHGRFQELRAFLQRTPIEMDLTENIDECWMQWKSNFQAAVGQFVPVKTITNKNSPPWIDCEVRYLIRKKYTALRKYRLDKSDSRKLKLRTISQNVKKLIRRKHREYLHKIESSFCSNPKTFLSYHKAMLHNRTDQNTRITYNGITAKTSREKAELFNSYFASVFQTSRLNNSTENDDYDDTPSKTHVE